MGRLRTMLGTVAAACAAMTLLVGAALAGNPQNPSPGGPPGQQGTPPGQAKKGTTGQGNANRLGQLPHLHPLFLNQLLEGPFPLLF